MRTRLFHGGPIDANEFFSGKLWFSKSLSRAMDYAGRGVERQVWMLLINEDQEVFYSEDDDKTASRAGELEEEGWDWQEAGWEAQTEQLENCFAKGGTVFMAEDGWALDMAGRKARRII